MREREGRGREKRAGEGRGGKGREGRGREEKEKEGREGREGERCVMHSWSIAIPVVLSLTDLLTLQGPVYP